MWVGLDDLSRIRSYPVSRSSKNRSCAIKRHGCDIIHSAAKGPVTRRSAPVSVFPGAGPFLLVRPSQNHESIRCGEFL